MSDEQWWRSSVPRDIRDAIAADVASHCAKTADAKVADTNPYIMAMMRGEGHAYWIVQNRLMSDLAKANQTIGMLNEQIDEAESERDAARREVCAHEADTAEDQRQYAAQRGWDCFKEDGK